MYVIYNKPAFGWNSSYQCRNI